MYLFCLLTIHFLAWSCYRMSFQRSTGRAPLFAFTPRRAMDGSNAEEPLFRQFPRGVMSGS